MLQEIMTEIIIGDNRKEIEPEYVVKERELKPLEYRHLKKSEKSYLKQQGISEQEFKNLDPLSQKEWKEECHEGAYADNNWRRVEIKKKSKSISFSNIPDEDWNRIFNKS